MDRHAPITYTYQWQRCDADGANCADIAGATASTLHADAAPTSATRSASSSPATNARGDDTATSDPTGASPRRRR